MGSHPSGPATLANAPDTTLSSWLDNNRSALGSVTQERFGIDLPFLFKASLQVPVVLLHNLCSFVSIFSSDLALSEVAHLHWQTLHTCACLAGTLRTDGVVHPVAPRQETG